MTGAAKRLLDEMDALLTDAYGGVQPEGDGSFGDLLRQVEAEAVDDERARIRAAVEGLRVMFAPLPDDDEVTERFVLRDEVLALLDTEDER